MAAAVTAAVGGAADRTMEKNQPQSGSSQLLPGVLNERHSFPHWGEEDFGGTQPQSLEKNERSGRKRERNLPNFSWETLFSFFSYSPSEL